MIPVVRECSYYNLQCYRYNMQMLIIVIMQKSRTKGWHAVAAIRCHAHRIRLGHFKILALCSKLL